MIAAIPTICLAYIFEPVAPDAPVVTLPSQTHDFRAMLTGSKSTYAFKCRNTLWDILFIDGIGKSCGCTSAIVDRTVVFPGQLFSITATLSAPGYDEDLSSHITLRGHAGRSRVQGQYELLGSINSALDFPDAGGGYLRLGSWPLDQLPAVSTVTVDRGKYPLDFDELRVDCPASNLSPSIYKTSPDRWRVSFEVSPTTVLGSMGYPLLPERVDQQAYFNILGPVTASPSSFLLTVSRGQHLQRTIVITQRDRSKGGAAPEIEGVSLSSPNVSASWHNSPQQCTVTLTYAAPTHLGTDSGEIVVGVKVHGTIYRLKVGYLAVIS
jgi:hypothetical protein